MALEWGLLLDPTLVPAAVTAGLMFLLAAWMLYLDAGKRVHRVFAAFLVFRGANILLATMSLVSLADPALSETFWQLSPFFTVATPFAILYFVLVYPRPRTFIGRHPYGALVPILGAAVFEYALLVDPTLMATLDVAPAGGLCASTEGFLCVVDYGPLIMSWGFVVMSVGIASLVLVRDYVRMEEGPARRSLFLVALAFLLTGLYDATAELLCVTPNCNVALGGWMTLNSWLVRAALVPLVLAAVLLLYWTRKRGDADMRSQVRRYRWTLPLPIVSAAVMSLAVGPALAAGTPIWEVPLAIVILGVWRLTLPLLVFYAVVKHQLFDLDVKVKWGIEKGTVASAFLLVFFLVSEGVEAALSTLTGAAFGDQAGLVMGLVAAGGLTLALGPLERTAVRVAERTMPGVRPVDTLEGDERVKFYREQFEIVLMDDEITAKERHLLDNLRDRLELEPEVAERLEREVLATRPSPAAAAASA